MPRPFLLLTATLFAIGCGSGSTQQPAGSTPQPAAGSQQKEVASPATPNSSSQNQEPDVPEKPDFVLTAEEFDKEFKANRDQAAKKYEGKLIELSGKVYFGSFVGRSPGVLVEGAPEKFSPSAVACQVLGDPDQLEPVVKSLSRGQSITLRGIGGPHVFNPVLEKCKIISVGPSTAKPITLRELAAILEDPERSELYKGSDVLVRVKVAEPGPKDSSFVYPWTVVDAEGGKKPVKFLLQYAEATGGYDEENVKVGDTFWLLARPNAATVIPALDAPRVFKELPPGIKLPAPKR